MQRDLFDTQMEIGDQLIDQHEAPHAPNQVKATNYDKWMEAYAKNLHEATRAHPEEYGYKPEDIGTERQILRTNKTIELMRKAMRDGTYNHDGRAFRMTCKQLGLKHTRKEINAFIQG